MTVALSAEQRSSLEKLVQGARQWIEEDLETRLAGSFGINTDGRIEDVGDLSLSNAQAAVRNDLVDIVEFLRSEGEDDEGSVGRLVREAAFTHTNRLVAVRVAEAIGLLPETIAKGISSTGFRDFSELAPTVATTEWGRFALFLRLCADELAADVPALFDPRNPLLELAMSEAVLAKTVEAISALGDDVWTAPDALGWAYQFFNTGEERRKMREASAPRNSRELAVRNQFFTPSYVVDFLVHNGLGAYLAAGVPGLAEELPLLANAPTERTEVDLEAVSVLDPACGSGHFLLGAYDVLERAWQHSGIGPAEAAPAIVRSLWGVDIDPRAAQIAQAAVMFRARRHCRDEKLPVASVICARSLPSGPEIDEFVDSLPEHVGRAVRGIADELVDAPVLGPLLKIEQRLDREVRDVFGTGVVEGTLAESAGGESGNIEAAVLDALSAIADSTTSTASQRLFAAEARDAVRFVESMARRYTAVVMNPPFGEPVASTKEYLKATYGWIPSKDTNLFAAFVGRGRELTGQDGSCAAITPRNGFFQSTYERWRVEVLLDGGLSVVADLGSDVMQGALVEAAAYVSRSASDGLVRFIRVLDSSDKAGALYRELAAPSEHGTALIPVEELRRAPSSMFLYHDPAGLRAPLLKLASLGETVAEARQGLITGDDFRFLRMWWEVESGEVWKPMPKGGAYSPYWREVEYLVDWGSDGERIRATGRKARVQGVEDYGKGGITWVARTNSALAPAYLPDGCVFSSRGPSIPIESDLDRLVVLGWLMSRPVRWFVEATASAGEESKTGGTAARDYTVGLLQRMPFPVELVRNETVKQDIAAKVRAIIDGVARLDSTREPSRSFVAPTALSALDGGLLARLTDATRQRMEIASSILEQHAELDETFLRLLASTHNAEIDSVCGPLVSRLDGNVVGDFSNLDEMRKAVRRSWGTKRWSSLNYHVVDRDLEMLCIAVGASPPSVIEAGVPNLGLDAESAAEELVSFAVGSTFKRWENTTACRLATRPLSPMEVNVSAQVRTSVDGPMLMVEQRGHLADLVGAVERELTLMDASGELLRDSVESLPARSLRDYISLKFFKSHLERYRSRSSRPRYAPIYWQLQVPSKTWGLWLYAPHLSRETLFAIVREAEQRQRLAEQQIGHLQRESEIGGSVGRKASEVAKELEAEQKLAVELASFRTEAERIANLGWEPDLDDGMVLNAAPLADLFPAWKDAATYRKELRAGKYEWATVARYAGQL